MASASFTEECVQAYILCGADYPIHSSSLHSARGWLSARNLTTTSGQVQLAMFRLQAPLNAGIEKVRELPACAYAHVHSLRSLAACCCSAGNGGHLLSGCSDVM
jgi:hypothetical protein